MYNKIHRGSLIAALAVVLLSTGFSVDRYTVVNTVDGVALLEDQQGNLWEVYGETQASQVLGLRFTRWTAALEDDALVNFW